MKVVVKVAPSALFIIFFEWGCGVIILLCILVRFAFQ